ncbi:MAG: hypothetical protein A2Y24_03000 [Clostridiales bacterium GWE2_32_10]|nr:MAG: hypothetical protein A2Y24_03000 [Clostridiales bacterium GWE2_32_10]HBY20588.1 hypothetical protein [Clostridiales bacterium]
MRMFGVPFDMEEEDKLIGGYLSLRQAGWLSIALIVAIVEFVVDMSWLTNFNIFIVILKVVILLIALAISAFLAFGSMDSMNSDSYVFKMTRFKLRKKVIKYNDK